MLLTNWYSDSRLSNLDSDHLVLSTWFLTILDFSLHCFFFLDSLSTDSSFCFFYFKYLILDSWYTWSSWFSIFFVIDSSLLILALLFLILDFLLWTLHCWLLILDILFSILDICYSLLNFSFLTFGSKVISKTSST